MQGLPLEPLEQGLSPSWSSHKTLMPIESLREAREQSLEAQALFRRAEFRHRTRTRRTAWWRHRRLGFLAGIVVLMTCSGALAAVSRVRLPEAARLDQTTFVCTADVQTNCGPGNSMAQLAAVEDRLVVPYSRVPAVLVDAVLAAEDRGFFSHPGVDPAGVARAVYYDLHGGESLQGGSTITQQYVKNVYLTNERTVMRKLREAVLAVKLEQRLSKVQILENYLNTIYFGRGAYGVGAASLAYFGKGVADVSLSEAAYLAGLIRSPESADATLDPVEATFRRHSVLAAMVSDGRVNSNIADQAETVAVSTLVVPRSDRTNLGRVQDAAECGTDYFADYVRRLLQDHFGPQVYDGGLRVYTTLDKVKQCAAYNAIYVDMLDELSDPAGSLISLDRDGRVVAMVGGRDFGVSQVNLALGSEGGGSGRQAGSAFKPFALAAWVNDGNSVLSTFPAPSSLIIAGADDGKDWFVKGGGSPSGIYTLMDATRFSSNTVYAQLVMNLGAERVAELATSLGMTSALRPTPSLVLGAAEVSVLDVATAYSNLARAGSDVLPSVFIDRVDDAEGRTVWVPRRDEPTLRARPSPLTQQVGDQVTGALTEVVRSGTGVQASVAFDAAGKTGTTEDLRDAWFAGYSCDLTTAVWMGYVGSEDQPLRAMRNLKGVAEVTGSTLPARIWSRFMSAVDSGGASCHLARPNVTAPGLRVRTVEPLPGQVPTSSVLAPPPIPSVPATSTTPAGRASTTTSTSQSTTTARPTATSSPSPSTSTPASSTSAAVSTSSTSSIPPASTTPPTRSPG